MHSVLACSESRPTIHASKQRPCYPEIGLLSFIVGSGSGSTKLAACRCSSENEFYANHLGAPPNHFANPSLSALENERKAIRRSAGWLNANNLRTVFGDIEHLALAMRVAFYIDPRVNVANSADFSHKPGFWLHCRRSRWAVIECRSK